MKILGINYLLELVKGAFKCVKAQIKYSRYGKELPTDEIARRLEICGRCVLEEQGVCTSCDCILVEKAKMSTENCPEDFWDNLDELVEK